MKSQNKKAQDLTAESQDVVISKHSSKVRRASIEDDGYFEAMP
jgi:hypothetical protein